MILIVDDDPRILSDTARILTVAGYDVMSAASGPEALGLISRHEKIAMMLTDVMMPDMNGPDLVSQAMIARPALKVLFMSGDIGNIPHRTFDHHKLLAKPFTAAQLLSCVSAML